MEAKFSTNVKNVISLSREEAIRLGNNYIGVEHIVLGMIRHENNSAINALNDAGVDIKSVKYSIEQMLFNGDDAEKPVVTGSIPLTKQCEKALKVTYLETKKHNDSVIRTVHLLSSILNDSENIVSSIFYKFKIDYDNFSILVNKYSLSSNGGDDNQDLGIDNEANSQLVYILDSALIYIKDHVEPAIGIKDIADEVANLIVNLNVSDKGKMIGIFGGWGRGKTFLMNLIWLEIKNKDEKFKHVLFHAWKYQDTPAIWAYLYEALANSFYESNYKNRLLRFLDRVFKIIKINIARSGYYNVFIGLIIVTGVAALFSATWYYKPFMFSSDTKIYKGFLIGGFLVPTSVLLVRLIKEIIQDSYSSAIGLFDKYYKEKSFEGVLGIQAEVQKEIKLLLRVWLSNKNEKLLLVVDDIDRCNEEKVIQVIDSLRVMLEDNEISKMLIVLAAVDERILKMSVRRKYYDFIDKDFGIKGNNQESNTLSNKMIIEYMDKLFIAGIKLARLSMSDKKELFSVFTKGQILYNDKNSNSAELTVNKKNIDEVESKDEVNITNANSNSTIISNRGGFVLEENEYDFISNIIGSFSVEMTPRQIRIFYYRYLIGRNILFKKNKVFQSQEEFYSIRNMLVCVLVMKCFENTDALESERIRVFFSEKEKELIIIFGIKFELRNKLVTEVFAVAEMVAGY